MGLISIARLTILFSLFAVIASADMKKTAPGITDGKLAACPSSPNCVCSQDPDNDHRTASIPYSGSSADAKVKIKKILMERARTKLAAETENYIHFECRSFIFGFVDDVEFFFPKDIKEIHVRSASRTGHYDFKVNRTRIDDIRASFATL